MPQQRLSWKLLGHNKNIRDDVSECEKRNSSQNEDKRLIALFFPEKRFCVFCTGMLLTPVSTRVSCMDREDGIACRLGISDLCNVILSFSQPACAGWNWELDGFTGIATEHEI